MPSTYGVHYQLSLSFWRQDGLTLKAFHEQIKKDTYKDVKMVSVFLGNDLKTSTAFWRRLIFIIVWGLTTAEWATWAQCPRPACRSATPPTTQCSTTTPSPPCRLLMEGNRLLLRWILYHFLTIESTCSYFNVLWNVSNPFFNLKRARLCIYQCNLMCILLL